MQPLAGIKMLKVMPSFPYPELGAEQIDRASGIRQAVRLGCEVSVIAKAVEWANHQELEAKAREWGAELTLVPYKYSNRLLSTAERMKKFVGKFRHPLYLDGAAYEYTDPRMREELARKLKEFKPDVVWFDYTYLWPLYDLVRQSGAALITQSNNFEPVHFLDEDGWTLKNYLKFIPKYFGERRSARLSDYMFAVTPKETKGYRAWGVETHTLPTRGLPRYVAMPRHPLRGRSPLHVVFMGASYKVEHNRAAARQVIAAIAPEVERRAPGMFTFHILGGKLPEELKALCDGKRVIYEGYDDDIDQTLSGMDIALIPSLMGAGMQQKVFEPMTRGIPTITSPRAIAEYPFTAGKEYLAAHETDEFVTALLSLQDIEKRRALAEAASRKTAELFSQEALDTLVTEGVKKALAARIRAS